MTRDDVDVARIVPSARDLSLALTPGRRSLVLVPFLDASALDAAEADLARLVESTRAFATNATGEAQRTLARATGDVPLLVTTPATSAEDCQRARYFGADGVCVPATAQVDVEATLLSARSMHMAPLLAVGDDLEASSAVAREARAWLLHGVDLTLARRAAALDRRRVLVVDASREGMVSAAMLRSLLGVVDAVLVPPELHRHEIYEALAAELDG